MFEELKEMIREMINDDELLDLGAQLLWKSHSALKRAGFTEEQADAIIAGKGNK